MNKLFQYLPDEAKEYYENQEITNAESFELEDYNDLISDIYKQFNVNTATWGLGIYERELDIEDNKQLNLIERRAIITSKWIPRGKTDDIILKTIIKSFTGLNIDIEFNGNLIFKLPYQDLDLTITGLINAINETKPAHLGYLFQSTAREPIILQEKYITKQARYNMCGQTATATVPVFKDMGNITIEEEYIKNKINYKMCGQVISGGV